MRARSSCLNLLGLTIALAATALAMAAPPDGYIRRQLAEIDKVNAAGHWKTDWSSLTRHQIPEWFQDAKFGIYAHWGVYSVPAHGNEWYPRRMYRPGDGDIYEHHVKTWGDPSRFGYKDFIPLFKAERFDPEAWAELYAEAGARFAGPVAEHHDGFSMWASKVNRWNAAQMGPKRDVTGELVAALRRRGLRIITSFHHAFNIQGYYTPREGWDTADPRYADLYGQFSDRRLALDRWLIKIKEVIDQYEPDQIWFDFGLRQIPDSYKQKMAAYYYNHEALWGKPVIITRKGNHLPEGVGALDIERAKMRGMGRQTWQTDDSVATNSWCWVDGLRLKTDEELVHELIDIVSKNGVLLLNVCPKADGTLPDDQRRLLRAIGRWLKVNGEAIYGTRPWLVHGEGPKLLDRGRGLGGHARQAVKFGPEDIRFTRSKDSRTLFATTLGWPRGPVTLTAVRVKAAPPTARVTLLGYKRPLQYHVNSRGQPVIDVPQLAEANRPCRLAYSFRLSGFQLDVQPAARFENVETIDLVPERAELFGRSIRLSRKGQRTRVENWKDPTAEVHWLVNVYQSGPYAVRGEFRTIDSRPEQLVLQVAGQKLTVKIPANDGAAGPQTIELGTLRFDRAGVYHLVLRAADPVQWRGVSVWGLQLAPLPAD